MGCPDDRPGLHVDQGVYVEAAVAEAFTAKLVAQVRALRTGPNGADAEIDFGPFTSPRQIEIVERHLADAGARRAPAHRGARVGPGPALCSRRPCWPASMMAIMREETFGPVVPVMAVADVEEAIRLANDSPYGLNASVWTRDVARGLAIAARIESGNVCVNECVLSAGVPALPFGGVKESGVGTRHGGAEGLRQFCVRQALLVESRRRRREPAWFPYSTRRARQIDRLLGWLFG
ncbi:MAG: aldehyde dehydrogenase family protein [Candidatus Binatia bacterium]